MKLKLIFWIVFFSTALAGLAQSNVNFIKRVQDYQRSVKMQRTNQFPNLIDTSTFNANHYLLFFDKLHMPPDLELHCVFYDLDLSGWPVLYVKKNSFDFENYIEQTFKNYLEQKSIGENKVTQEFRNFKKNEILCGFAMDSVNQARWNIIPEDNRAGYLQFLFFNRFGEQFALKWHSNVNQTSVIYSKNEVDRLYKYYSKTDDFSCDLTKFQRLSKIKVTPTIRMKKDKCLITWYEIATHHGIYQTTYEISRSHPHQIRKLKDIEVLKINMNFIY
jgi:hypothetical protein